MLIDPHLSAAWRGAFAAPEGCKDFADSITLHRKDNITRWRGQEYSTAVQISRIVA
jgi:hypothetical protein